MKITKFTHSCLLVEMPAPTDRTALFDPGEYSHVPIESLKYLDDIIVTHAHQDHMDVSQIKKLREKFPKVRITAPAEAIAEMEKAGITGATSQPSEGIRFFNAPHESIKPLAMVEPAEEVGIHYLEMFSHPGDSHQFSETMPVLALPMTGPWERGYAADAARVAFELKPRYVIPVHDWPWHDEARQWMYDRFEKRLAEEDITFIKAVDGEPFVIKL